MNQVRNFFLCSLLASLTALSWQAYRVLGELPGRVEYAIQAEMDETRDSLQQSVAVVLVVARDEIRQTRKDLLEEAGRIRQETRLEARQTREDALARVDKAITILDARTASIERETAILLRTLGGNSNRLVDAYGSFPSSLLSRYDSAVGPWVNCSGNGACWQAQLTATLGASRATMGETSRTMREIRGVTPEIVRNINQTAANVERITRPDHWTVRLVRIGGPFLGGWLVGALK